MTQLRKGEVYWIDFDPAVGGEIKKTRPAVIVSNDTANRHLNRIVVVPLTGNVEKCYPAEAIVQAGGKSAKAMADQITAVSKLRVGKKLGELSQSDLEKINVVIAQHLDLSGSGRGVIQ